MKILFEYFFEYDNFRLGVLFYIYAHFDSLSHIENPSVN